MATVKSSTDLSSRKKSAKASSHIAPVTAQAEKPAARAEAATASRRVAPRPRARKTTDVTVEQRMHHIAVAAYYIAERRSFAPGDLLADWVQAEAEIDCLLTAKPEGLLDS